MKLRFTILILCFLTSLASAQTTIRVGPTATGNGSGSDWNNLAQWSSVTLTRGNTYVFRGSETQYGGRTLNTANSGTTRITLKYAWPDEYGSETGWSNTFTNNYARFSGTLDFKTDYWTVTGVRRDSVNWTNGFGFWLAQGQSFTDGGPAGDHLEFIYLKFGASLDDGINGGYNAGDNRVIRDNRFYDAPNWSVSTSGVDHGNNEALGAAPWSTWNEFIAYGLSEGGGEPAAPAGATMNVGTLIITGP